MKPQVLPCLLETVVIPLSPPLSFPHPRFPRTGPEVLTPPTAVIAAGAVLTSATPLAPTPLAQLASHPHKRPYPFTISQVQVYVQVQGRRCRRRRRRRPRLPSLVSSRLRSLPPRWLGCTTALHCMGNASTTARWRRWRCRGRRGCETGHRQRQVYGGNCGWVGGARG